VPAGPELAVVCVTWNSAAHLPALLASLGPALEGVTWGLWVVDNASADASVALVRDLAPEAVVVQTGSNAGYAAGINAGLRAAPPQAAALVLNPDVRLDPGCGSTLMRALSRGDAGITVPVQRDGDGRLHPTLRRAPAVRRAVAEALLGGRLAGRLTWGELVTHPDAYLTDTRADWATGSVMAISRLCLDAVGEWDERFFLYSEETDFALRAATVGFDLRLAPLATCEHRRGASHEDPRLWALLTTNRVRLFAKRHNSFHAFTFRLALLAGELARALRGSASHRASAVALLGGERRAAALIQELRRSSADATPASAPGRPTQIR
jgi:N-acetylglucosaminyl-diphospho-decaprenol L-rhamnosyltransferase